MFKNETNKQELEKSVFLANQQLFSAFKNQESWPTIFCHPVDPSLLSGLKVENLAPLLLFSL
jgi:hypothetical protein